MLDKRYIEMVRPIDVVNPYTDEPALEGGLPVVVSQWDWLRRCVFRDPRWQYSPAWSESLLAIREAFLAAKGTGHWTIDGDDYERLVAVVQAPLHFEQLDSGQLVERPGYELWRPVAVQLLPFARAILRAAIAPPKPELAPVAALPSGGAG